MLVMIHVFLLSIAMTTFKVDSIAMTTFKVDEVTKEKLPLPVARPEKQITSRIGVTPESVFKYPASLNCVHSYIKNPFVASVHVAYDKHYPLVLTPDIIWQCIVQGFSIHVNENAEDLKNLFVSHEGKKELKINVDNFVKGSPDNDWESCLGMFSEEIRKNVGDDIHGLLTPEFSTTGPTEKASAQAVMMDAFKEYFDYTAVTLCGIPEITLEGTMEDWKALREKALKLSQFKLEWWMKALKPVLDEFVNAASGNASKGFWQSIYKIDGGSGGPYISGWILTLFPYIGPSPKSLSRSQYLEDWGEKVMFPMGATTNCFPHGDVSVPFKWEYLGTEYDMYFYAGFLGLGQHKETLALRPLIGWAVVDKEEEDKAKLMMRSRFY